MITESDVCQKAVVAGMGGGDGMTNISWGANSSFAKRAMDILNKKGLREYNSIK